MNLDNVYICDIETKGFLKNLKGEPSDLHVMGVSYLKEGKWDIYTTKKESDVRRLFENPNNTIVGHNFFLYDIPAIEKIFKGIKVKATIIDSLFVSWYIEPNRIKQGKKHGLESYGEDFGVKKPEIETWTDLTYEEYENRVIEDCKINTNLWIKQLRLLRELYDSDDEKVKSLLFFLSVKGKQYKMHQDYPLRLNRDKAIKYKNILEDLENKKVEVLSKVMPKVPIKVKRTKPKNCFKKDGTLSKAGERWFKLIEGCNLPDDYEGEIEEIIDYKLANPKSNKQVKEWLFSIGWVADLYIESTLKSGEINKVPQIRDKNKNLCKSVLKLAEKEPAIKELEDMGVISHRLGIIKGFLRDSDEEGNIVAGIAGLTNTLRIRHKYLVNMPKPSAPYGEYIRSLIIAPEGCSMIGSDLSGLENTTRNNFIYPYDPEYVEQMNDPYYDSHLDIGIVANIISKEEALFYKWMKEKKKNPEIKPEDIEKPTVDYNSIVNAYKTEEEKQEFFDKIDKRRSQAKTLNYSSLYGIGKIKLAKDLKIKVSEAENMLKAYWVRNWSVRQFAEDQKVKTIKGQMWIKNPLNGYYYSLRGDKDRFSTLNQGVGDYIFTLWIYYLMEMGVVIRGGWHDECLIVSKLGKEQPIVDKLYKSIEKVNKVLNLKLPVGIDYNVGKTYEEVH